MAAKSSSSATKTTPSAVVITNFPTIPLTATFTPPGTECGGVYASSGLWVIDDETSCLPSFFNEAPTAYYSPGIACPSGYTTACHDTRGVSSITTVTCCPFRGDAKLTCQPSPNALSGIFSTVFCTWAPSGDTTQYLDVTLSSNGVTTTSVATFGAGGVNALGIRMVYESSDLPGFSSTTSPASNTATTTSGGTSPTSGTSTPKPSSGGLSTGAKAAIGVVIPLVVLAVLAGLFFWWRRRNQKYKAVAVTAGAGAHTPTQDTKVGGQQLYGGSPIYELGTPQPELMGDPGKPQRAELVGER